MALIPYRDQPDRGELAGRAWIELMAPAVELAKAIAGTEFVPRALRNNPAAIAAAILYGDEVGLGPLQSLSKIAVIDGRPALAAEAQRALILAAGHDLWIEDYTITTVTIAGRRRDSERANAVTWTMDDARRAGLAGRPNWRNYPRQMLLARSSAELARATFADVIGGLAALEELEAPDDTAPAEAGAVPIRPAENASSPRRRRRKLPTVADQPPEAPTFAGSYAKAQSAAEAPPQPRPTVLPAQPPEQRLPPLPGEEHTPSMSSTQRRRLMAAFRSAGFSGSGERARRLTFASDVIGRTLSSSNELSADEAAHLIEVLESDPGEWSDEDTSQPAPADGNHLPEGQAPAAGAANMDTAGAGDEHPARSDPAPADTALPLDLDAGHAQDPTPPKKRPPFMASEHPYEIS